MLFGIFKATVVNCVFFLLFPSLFLAFQPPSNLFPHSALGSISILNKNSVPFLTLSIVVAAVHFGILKYGVFSIMVSNYLNNISCKKEIQLPLKLPYANCHTFWMASAVCFHSRIQSEPYMWICCCNGAENQSCQKLEGALLTLLDVKVVGDKVCCV